MPIDLDTQLTKLRRSILTMGTVVEQRVRDAIDSLLEQRADVARTVREGDQEIDRMDVDLESECLRVLALTQPVATDLRLVLAVLRINNELERIGDEAQSIAKRVLDLGGTSPLQIPPVVRRMAEASAQMLSDALTALAESDAGLCRKVLEADAQVNECQKDVFEWAQQQIRRDVESTRAVIDLVSVARRLERIGDLSTNIAEGVIFLLEGAQVRHGAHKAPPRPAAL